MLAHSKITTTTVSILHITIELVITTTEITLATTLIYSLFNSLCKITTKFIKLIGT